MKNMIYLIRDKEVENEETRVMEEMEYSLELNKLLLSNAMWYLDNGSIDNLINLEDTIRALLKLNDISYEEFEKMRKEKNKKQGTYEKRICFKERKDKIETKKN